MQVPTHCAFDIKTEKDNRGDNSPAQNIMSLDEISPDSD
jgi:hypothetical protein